MSFDQQRLGEQFSGRRKDCSQELCRADQQESCEDINNIGASQTEGRASPAMTLAGDAQN